MTQDWWIHKKPPLHNLKVKTLETQRKIIKQFCLRRGNRHQEEGEKLSQRKRLVTWRTRSQRRTRRTCRRRGKRELTKERTKLKKLRRIVCRVELAREELRPML